MCRSKLCAAMLIGAIVGSAASSRAAVITSFGATLSPDQVVPPEPAADSEASGLAVLGIDSITDDFNLVVLVAGIPASDIIGADLHVGATGVNGPVIFDLLDTLNGGGTFAQAGDLAALAIAGAAFPATHVGDLFGEQTYIQIKTNAIPTGELRGQLIPEPQTLALMSVGGVFGLLMRSRHRYHTH